MESGGLPDGISDLLSDMARLAAHRKLASVDTIGLFSLLSIWLAKPLVATATEELSVFCFVACF